MTKKKKKTEMINFYNAKTDFYTVEDLYNIIFQIMYNFLDINNKSCT